jgi:general secretion pathway protein G
MLYGTLEQTRPHSKPASTAGRWNVTAPSMPFPVPDATRRTARRADRRRAVGGFTLLELLVVMVIIGLLAAYVAPRYFSQVGKSEVRSAQAQIAALRNALDTYRLDVGSYPTTEQGLAALTARPQNSAKWNGPYLQRAVPPDPWGRPYQYRSPGEHAEYDLLSLGKDGQPGGIAEAADITSWQ